MRMIRAWILRFGGLFDQQRKDRELDDEIESHIQMHIENNLRLGMTPEEARREALIKLGGIESMKEAYRDQRGLPVLETLWQDIRYGARMLRKNSGFVALVLASIGLYGMMSYSVSQRTSEIGIRVALGAQRRDVLTMVIRQAIGLALLGVVAGLATALALARLLRNLLFGVGAADPLTFGVVAFVLLAVAFLASFVPARRAAKVDLMVALRYE